jgi:hypothetical protein
MQLYPIKHRICSDTQLQDTSMPLLNILLKHFAYYC